MGCGNGALILAVAPRRRPDGHVVGLDLSQPMLAEAHRRSEAAGLRNTTFEHGDAQIHPLPDGGFDALMSRFGVMFFADPAAAFANLTRSLRPGGRLVVACSPNRPQPASDPHPARHLVAPSPATWQQKGRVIVVG